MAALKAFTKFVSGNRLHSGDKLNNIFQGFEPVATIAPAADNLVARAGGGQANALQLSAIYNRVTTVVTAGDSVKLPPSKPGDQRTVLNSGASNLQVYGSGSDTINGAPAATGITVAPGKEAEVICFSYGAWLGPVALA